MEDNKSLKEEIQELKEMINTGKNKKKKEKKFRMPRKANVSRLKMKKGFITVIVIGENKSIDFIKKPITDGTIKLKDTFHAIEDKDIFFYKNKPIIIQPKSKLNPYNPLEGEHETYGQKYVMARMEGDKIVSKKQMGWGLTIGGIIVAAIIGYSFLTGG